MAETEVERSPLQSGNQKVVNYPCEKLKAFFHHIHENIQHNMILL
jgi:hypothetical protein